MGVITEIRDILQHASDRVTRHLVSITSDHSHIHKGVAFTYSGKTSEISAGGTYIIIINTPGDRFIHWRPAFIASTANLLEVRFSEGSTYTGGTPVTPWNRNRYKNSGSKASISIGATESAEGLILEYFQIGSGGVSNKAGGNLGADEEIVLAKNTTYELRFENIGSVTATIGYYRLFWYDELEA